MKSSIRDKLEHISQRHEELERLLSSQEVGADMDAFAATAANIPNSARWLLCMLRTDRPRRTGGARPSCSKIQRCANWPRPRSPLESRGHSATRARIAEGAPAAGPGRRSKSVSGNPRRHGRRGGGAVCGRPVADVLALRRAPGWRVEVVSTAESELGGYKEVILRVIGARRVRAARSSPVAPRATGSRHRNPGADPYPACTVAVMPEADELAEVNISPADLRIDTYRASGPVASISTRRTPRCGSPTRRRASWWSARTTARNIGTRPRRCRSSPRGSRMQLREQQARTAATRKSLVGSGDRSERIRTYNSRRAE